MTSKLPADQRRTLEQQHDLLAQRVKGRRENVLKEFVPYAKQREFIAATREHTESCLRAGNQQGKTLTGAAMAAIWLTGLYPDWWQGRRWDRPVRMWAGGESTIAVRDVVQRKLCGPPGDEANFGTGMIPKHLLVGKILGHGAGGALDKIMVRHAGGGTSELTFKSYDQERSKWQGESLDAIWLDEEPPLPHYLEALARLIATGGLIYSTFTPLNGLNGVLPRFMERSPEAARHRSLIAMRLDDAEHLRDPARREQMLSAFPAHQRKARIDGLPIFGSALVFNTPVEKLISPFTLHGNELTHETHGLYESRHLAKIWGIDFGIGHPFAAVLVYWDRDTDVAYVVAELKISDAGAPIHASRMRAIAAGVRVAWPHDGSQRDKGSGDVLADIYKREGLDMLPQHATHAAGGYDTEAGIMEMDLRAQDGRLQVSRNCYQWMDEYQQYHRKEGRLVKVDDDLMSATRVAIMALRKSRDGEIGSTRRGVGVGTANPRMAAGLEYSFDW